MKRYVMTVSQGQSVPASLHETVAKRAGDVLCEVGEGHGVGFVLVHRARPADFVLIDWWERGLDLRQRYFRADHGHPGELEELPLGAIGCVWELEVVLHERAAWIANVLDADVADYEGYLEEVYRYPV